MKKVTSLLISTVLISSLLPFSNLEAEATKPTIYVSIVSHNEEPSFPNHPDFTSDYDTYESFRDAAVAFSEMLHDEGVKYDFQSDWNFLLAEQDHWDEFDNTNGKNLLRWLVEDMDFAVDPHAHESTYSIADVAYLMEQLDITPSNIVGGFIATPAEDSRVEDFQVPIEGWQYDTTWEADALWGGGSGNHVDDEGQWTSGIWRPQDNENFFIDDPDSKPVIGTYTSTWDGLDDLLEKRDSGELEAGKMYTATIMTNQEDAQDQDFIDEFQSEIQARQSYTDSGAIEWVTLTEALNIWEDDYDSTPETYNYEQGEITNSTAATDPSDDTGSNEPAGSTSTPFTDIDGHWGEEVITTLYDMGAIQGKSSTSFAPDDSMTRAELLKVALLTAGKSISSSESTSAFSDVETSDWFMPYVAYGYKEGYIEGYEDGSFRPNDTINRAEALTILLRVAGANVETLGSGTGEGTFTDIEKEDWFFTYVLYAKDNDIVDGYSDGSFGPGNNVSRAEFCTMAVRTFLE